MTAQPTLTVGPVFCDERYRPPYAFTIKGDGQVAVPRFYTPEQANGARRCFIADARQRGQRVTSSDPKES